MQTDQKEKMDKGVDIKKIKKLVTEIKNLGPNESPNEEVVEITEDESASEGVTDSKNHDAASAERADFTQQEPQLLEGKMRPLGLVLSTFTISAFSNPGTKSPLSGDNDLANTRATITGMQLAPSHWMPTEGHTNNSTPQLQGTLSKALVTGQSLRVLRDDHDVGSATTSGTTWTFQDGGLQDGQRYTYKVHVKDATENTGPNSNIYAINIDTSTPTQTVVITNVVDNVDNAPGETLKGVATNDETPELHGTLSEKIKVDERVEVLRDGQVVGTAIVDINGTAWRYRDSGLGNSQTYSYTARVVDRANNLGDLSAPFILTIDTVAPTASVAIVSYTDNVAPAEGDFGGGSSTNDTNPLLNGMISGTLADGERVSVLRDGVLVGHAIVVGNTWTFQDSGLSNGQTYSYTARVVDRANNQGDLSAPLTLTIDTEAPTATTQITAISEDRGVTGDFVTNDNTLVISGTNTALGLGERVQVSLDGGVVWRDAVSLTNTTWSLDNTANALPDGTYNVRSRVVDAALNAGAEASQTVRIDSDAPRQSVQIVTVVDNVAPEEGDVANNGFTNDTTPEVRGTLSVALGADERVEVLRDGQVVGTATVAVNGTNWTFTDAGLVNGMNYTYTVRVADLAGNNGAPSNPYSIRIDTSAPTQVVTITGVTDDVAPGLGNVPNGGSTNDSQPEVRGSISQALAPNEVVAIYRGGVKIGEASVNGTSWVFDDRTGGFNNGSTYQYTARVEDAAGNTGDFSGVYGITFQTTGPNITATITAINDDQPEVLGVVANNGHTNDTTPQLQGTLSQALVAGQSLRVLRDGVDVGSATTNGTTWTFQDGGLQDGQRYSYTVRVEDAANNPGPSSNSYAINIDTSAPTQTVEITNLIDNVDPVSGEIVEGGTTNDGTPELRGTISTSLSGNEQVRIFRNGVDVGTATITGGGTTWTFTDGSLASGSSYTYTARVVDAAGNQSAASNSRSFSLNTSGVTQTVQILDIVDDQGPQTGSVANAGFSNDTTPLLRGSISAPLNTGDRVEILRDGQVVGTATVAVNGTNWTFTDAGLVNGMNYTYTVRVADLAGNNGAPSNPYSIRIDTSAPTQAVTITGVTDDVAPGLGNVPNGGSTNDSQPEVRGSISQALAPNEVVAIYRGGVKIGEASVNGTSWVFDDRTGGFNNGSTYQYTARVEDAAGNTGDFSGVYGITFQTTGPNITATITAINDDQPEVLGVVANNGHTNDTTPQLQGTLSQALVAGQSLRVLRDGVDVGSATTNGTTWTFQDGGLQDGQRYSYTVRVEDAANNPGPSSNSYAINIDTSAPTQTVEITNLIDNVDPVSGEIVEGGTTNDGTPELRGTISTSLSGNEQVRIFRNGVDVGTATITGGGTTWTFTDGSLASGNSYTYTARVVDAAGNQSAASNSRSFSLNTSGVTQTVQILDIVDDQGPQTGSVANAGFSNDTTPLLRGSISAPLNTGDRVEILRDGQVVGTATVVTNGTTWSFQDSGLVDGQRYTYTARVVNSGSNEGAPSADYVINIDTSEPTASVAIVSYTDNVAPAEGDFGGGSSTNDTNPLLNGTISGTLADGERVSVLRDGVLVGHAIVVGNTWTFQDSGLSNGQTYSYTARVVDRANNQGDLSAPLTLTIDTEAPTATTQITAISEDRGVTGDFVTNDNTLVISGTNTALGLGERVQVSLDGGVVWRDAVSLTNTTWSLDNTANALPDGTYNVRSRVVDAALNAGAEASQTVRIDSDAPRQSVQIVTVVDNVAPEEGDVANNGFTNDTTPEVRGTLSVALGADERVEVLRDGQVVGTATVAVNGTNWTFTDAGLVNGMNYTYTVRVADLAGNNGAPSNPYSIRIDTSAPTQVVTITGVTDDVAPGLGNVPNGGSTNDSQPEVRGSISQALAPNEVVAIYRGGVKIGEASVNGTSWVFDDRTGGFNNGSTYQYTARVEDAAGNTGDFSGVYGITFQTTGPNITATITAINDDQPEVLGVVANNGHTNDTTPQLQGTLSQALVAGQSLRVLRDGVDVGSATTNGTTWTFQDGGLQDGQRYSYTVRVEDAANNPGPSSNSYAINIDTSAPTQTVEITNLIDNVDPVSGEIVEGGTTNDGTPELRGTISTSLSGNEQVRIFRNGVDVGTATITGGGTTWTFTDGSLASGSSYTYTARVVDAAGNQSAASNSRSFSLNTSGVTQTVQILDIVDDQGPQTGSVANAGFSNDTTPLLRGSISAPLNTGDRVEILRDGQVVGTATVVTNGTTWSFQDSGLVDGQRYTYTARVVNSGSNEGAPSADYVINIDTSAPTQVVTITGVTDDVAPGLGNVPNGGSTNDSQPEVRGSISQALAPNEVVAIYRGGVKIGEASVNGTSWVFDDRTGGFNNGSTYQYTARVEDAAGNTGDFSGVYGITFQTTGPNITATITAINDDQPEVLGVVANNGHTNDTTPQLQGTLSQALVAGQSLRVLRDGVDVGSATTNGTTWTFQDGGLQDGQRYSYTVRVEDAANNPGPSSNSYAINIDTSAPTQTVEITNLIDNVDPVSGEIVEGGTTNDGTPELRGTISTSLSGNEQVRIFRNGVDVGTATITGGGTTWTFTDGSLASGNSYTYTARVVDAAGNQSAASNSRSFSLNTSGVTQTVQILDIVDDQGPQTGSVANAGFSNDTTPLLRGSISAPLNTGDRVEILRDGQVVGTATVVTNGTTWSFQDSGLVDGQRYTYTARVVNSGSNEGAPSADYVINIDTSAPTQVVTITGVTDDVAPGLGNVPNGGSTNDSQPEVRGSISQALAPNEVVAIYRGGVKIGEASVNGTSWVFDDRTGGFNNGSTYQYTARVEDAAGNTGDFSGVYGITFQTTGPNITATITAINDDQPEVLGVVANNGHTNDTTPQLQGTLSQALVAGQSLRVLRDGVDVGSATTNGTTWTFQDGGLQDGQRYSYTVRVEDAANNPGPSSNSYAINIDTSAPTQTVEITNLIDNVDPVSGEIVEGGTTNDGTPELRGTISTSLSGNEQVRIFRNGVDVGTATITGGGTTWTFTDGSLASGNSYTYTARVVDAAGNQSAASNSRSFSLNTSGVTQTVQILDIVDDQGPQTGSVANAGFSNDTTPLLRGSISAPLNTGDRVEILRDGQVVGTATVVTNGTTWSFQDSGLVDGQRYTYTARVVNSGSNEGAPSADYVINIDTSEPTASVAIVSYTDNVAPAEGDFGGGSSTNDTNPLLNGTISGTLADGERVSVLRDGVLVGHATVVGNTWTFQDSGLSNGQTYSYTARVVDRANNQGDLSAPLTLTIDTEAPTANVAIVSYTDNVAPAEGDFGGGSSTNDTNPLLNGTISGTLADGERVSVLRDGVLVGHAVVVGNTWTFQDSGLSNGQTYSYTARVVDRANNQGDLSAPLTLTIDTEAPTANVAIVSYTDNVAPAEGDFGGGSSTNDTNPLLNGTISGTLADGERVSVLRDGVLVGHATVVGNTWTFQDSGLSNGQTYSYTARVVDRANNQGDLSAPLTLTIDTEAPTANVAIVSYTDNVAPAEGDFGGGSSTNDTNPLLNGTISGTLADGERVSVLRDGVLVGHAVVVGNTWTFQDSGLSNGQTYSYTARVVDRANNQGDLSAPLTLTIDTEAPTTPPIVWFNEIGSELHGEGAEPGTTVTITSSDGLALGSANVDAYGNFIAPLNPAQENGEKLTIIAIDGAGNSSTPKEVHAPIILMLSDIGANVSGFSMVDGNTADFSGGISISNAGDVNGDGFNDIIIGSPLTNLTNRNDAGISYIVFGKENMTSVNLSAIRSGSGGFVVNGRTSGDGSGFSVSGAGDVNGDGLSDLIVSAPDAASKAGKTYVVFGKSGTAAVNLSAVESGSGGFVINGINLNERSGYQIANAGDINGDGLSDVIIGSSIPTMSGAGRSYVVFGKTNTAAVNLSSIVGGTGGFVIEAENSGDQAGFSVSSAGDVNGDGLADFIVGAPQSLSGGTGISYVVFGKKTGTPINLSTINSGGGGGFSIKGSVSGDMAGHSVSNAGDVNGDGLADLILSAPAYGVNGTNIARAYVVFGKNNTASVDLSSVAAGHGGFMISSKGRWDDLDMKVSNAGDINGDGLADIIVSTPAKGENLEGFTYVIFGKTDQHPLELHNLGTSGFSIRGNEADGFSGASIAGGEDINGDGLSDILIGVPGDYNKSGFFGGHVIFGSTTGKFNLTTKVDQIGTTGNDNLTDSGISKTLVGGRGDDTFTATAASILYGGIGNDTFIIGQAMVTALQSPMGEGGNIDRLARIDGGKENTSAISWYDTIVLSGSNLFLDLTKISNQSGGAPGGGSRIESIERITMTDVTQKIALTASDVLDMGGIDAFALGTRKTQLMISSTASGTKGILALMDSGWSQGTPATFQNETYDIWDNSLTSARLYIERGITII
jgi:uncharacterized Zn ribbon protein